MGQHTELVNRRRKVLNAEIWREKIKQVMMVAKKNGKKTWTTTYNDGRVETEYWGKEGFLDKEHTISSTMTIDDCIDQMSREEADATFSRN